LIRVSSSDILDWLAGGECPSFFEFVEEYNLMECVNAFVERSPVKEIVARGPVSNESNRILRIQVVVVQI
jgi:hypothetical protein